MLFPGIRLALLRSHGLDDVHRNAKEETMLILAGVVIVVAGVVPVVAMLARALGFRSKCGRRGFGRPLDLDVKAAVERLAGAIRFPTVSAQGAAAADPRPFRD